MGPLAREDRDADTNTKTAGDGSAISDPITGDPPFIRLAETEPNDTPGQANPSVIGTVGDTAASLSTGSDVDWFRVTVIQDYWYVFETYNVSPLVDTRLILYDQDGSTQLA